MVVDVIWLLRHPYPGLESVVRDSCLVTGCLGDCLLSAGLLGTGLHGLVLEPLEFLVPFA